MKIMSMLMCAAGMIAGLAGVTRADVSADRAAYKQKMHDCATQMKIDHPDMNHDARRKACRDQLGPSPKATAVTPAVTPTAPAPATP